MHDKTGTPQHRSRIVFVFIAMASMAAVHCSDASTGQDGQPAPDSHADGGVTPTGSGVVTPSGGGVVRTSDGRVTLEFPPGAVSGDTVVTIAPASAYPPDPGLVAGSVYDLAPSGIVFSQPVMMTIAYEPASIPSGVVESELRIQKVSGAAWTALEGSTVDPAKHSARVALRGFSTYGVRGISAAPALDAGIDQDAGQTQQEAGPVEPPEGELFATSGVANIGGIAADATHVYWSGFNVVGNGGCIERKAVAGGAVEPIVTNQLPIWGATTVGNTIYFANEAAIRSVPKSGGTPALHASHSFVFGDGALATDGTHLYWAGRMNGDEVSVFRTSAASPSCAARTFSNVSCNGTFFCDDVRGTGPLECTDQGNDALAVCCEALETFAPMRGGSKARAIVVDGDYAYWTENSSSQAWLLRKALAGGAVETLATELRQNNSANTYGQLAVAGGRVYWQHRLDAKISSVPLAGGTPVKEVDASIDVMVADATHLYFLVDAPQAEAGIHRRPLAGGATTWIAKGSLPRGLAVTSTQVYWSDGLSIRRLAK